MTLSQLLALNSLLTIPNLQMGYEYAVKKIRLNPTAFPALLSNACRVGGFAYPAYLLSDSEVAFKELHTVDGVSFDTECEVPYTVANLVLGNDGVSGFGFDGFVSFNENHETQPEIHWAGTDIICLNLDAAFIWVTGFVYPYFVTCGDPYADAHVYSIRTMTDSYGADSLTVDPVLLYPVSLKALGIAHQDYGNLAFAATLDGMANTVINLYNQNPELYRSNFVFGSNTIDAGIL